MGKKIEIEEIELYAGCSIDDAVATLQKEKEKGRSVYCDFNGHKLFSDNVTIDSAYVQITGMNKAAHDKKQQEWLDNYKKEQAAAEKRAKQNIPMWIEKGKKYIYPEMYEKWEKMVEIRAEDLYHGFELDASLEIMEALSNGSSMEEAKQIFENQGHSGTSAGLVRNIIFTFSKYGPDFFMATLYGDISPEVKTIIEEKRKENEELELSNTPGKKM